MPQSHIPIHAHSRFKAPLWALLCRLTASPFVVKPVTLSRLLLTRYSHIYSVQWILLFFLVVICKIVLYLYSIYPQTSLTDLQYVVHAAALQQSDAPAERQPRFVDALPVTPGLFPASVERRVHANLPFASRERPVNDPSLNGLRDPLKPLLYPLKRPLLRDFPCGDVQQGLRVLGLARAALAGSGSATRRPRGPLALPTCCTVSWSTAEPLGRGLLYALRHDSSALTATEEVNAPYERDGEGKRLPTA